MSLQDSHDKNPLSTFVATSCQVYSFRNNLYKETRIFAATNKMFELYHLLRIPFEPKTCLFPVMFFVQQNIVNLETVCQFIFYFYSKYFSL